MNVVIQWLTNNWKYAVIAAVLIIVIVLVIVLITRIKKHNNKKKNAEVASKVRQIHKQVNDANSSVKEKKRADGNVTIAIYQNGEKRKEVSLDLTDSKFVGRSDMVDLYLDDEMMSRQHFVLDFDGIFYYITDLDTTNGTIVNGKRITEKTQLECNDRIRVGTSEMIIRW